jgi:hypothetical protein
LGQEKRPAVLPAGHFLVDKLRQMVAGAGFEPATSRL